MTIQLLFFTIIINWKKKEEVHEDYFHEEHSRKVDDIVRLSNVMQNKVW
ncbi:hypothetical protein V1498_06135 [Peribacillus sp. SCS-26]